MLFIVVSFKSKWADADCTFIEDGWKDACKNHWLNDFCLLLLYLEE